MLAATAALIAYLMWPPSAATLFAKAQPLMASDDPAGWSEVNRHILPELDRRFPTLYVAEKQAWRDRIGLRDAERRAAVLEKPNLGALSEPKGFAQITFVDVFNQAAGAMKAGDDADAAAKWRDMAEILAGSKDPADRPWSLLAQGRAKKVTDAMAKRRESVNALLDRADLLVQQAKPDDAERLRRDVARRYGRVRDLKELILKRTGIDPDAPAEGEGGHGEPIPEGSGDSAPRVD